MQFEYDEDPWGRRFGGEDKSYGPPIPPAPTPAPAPTTGAAAAGVEDVPAFNYQTPAYTGSDRPTFNFPDVPQFHAPRFVAPTADSMYADPSYQFRLQQGLGALQNSAAGKGILRTGGSLKSIEDYGQNAASQEYSNIFNRALQDYGTQYQAAKDTFAPNLLDYGNRFAAEQQAGLSAFDRDWDRYTFPIQDEFNREQLLMNSQLPQ